MSRRSVSSSLAYRVYAPIAARHAHSARKNIFRPRGRRSLCSLGVRPKNLSAFRFARLACVLNACMHFVLLASFSAFPKGKGDREERAVDEGCFRPTYAFQLRNTAVTACTHTGNCLAGAVFRCLHIVFTRLSHRVTPTRLEKNIFRPRGRRSLCSLGVRPKNLR